MARKRREGLIKVGLNSGANIHSTNEATLDPEDLGFDSMEEWQAATDDEKQKAVEEYWAGMGYPEIWWEDQ